MPGELRAPLITLDPLSEGDSDVRVNVTVSVPLTEGTPNLRENAVALGPLTEGTPNIRLNVVTAGALSEGFRNLRCSLLIVETLHPVEPEEFMATEVFPGFGNSLIDPAIPAALDPFNSPLPGLTFSVHKKPNFKTRLAEAANAREDASSLTPYPRWEYELEYEFLEDRSGAASSLKTIVGFFLNSGGRYGLWLFKDPDDYLADSVAIATADGVTTQFYMARTFGGFLEPVGQVDTANNVDIHLQAAETHAVPAVGPYTITVDEAAAFVSDQGVTRLGVALTRVTGAPGAMQYQVDELTGIYTFNVAQDGDNVVITYRYLADPLDYTLTLPNRLIFDSAPADGLVIYASFQYFFVCRFLEDGQDYEKFADKLWNLQECNFRSVITS